MISLVKIKEILKKGCWNKTLRVDLFCKLMDWFLYDIGLRRERVK